MFGVCRTEIKFGFVETREEGNGGNFGWYLCKNGLESRGQKFWGFSLQREQVGQGGVNKVFISQGYRALLGGPGASILETRILNKIHSCSMLRFYFLENCSHISPLKQLFYDSCALAFTDLRINKLIKFK